MTIRTIAVLLLVGGMLMSACSDDPLADAGRLTNDWIGESSTAARDTTPSTAAPPAYRSAFEVAWFNDFLTADLRSADPAEALAAVWARRESGNKYVQAARTEIAGALPGVAFPELLPEDVEFISSQLLFDGDGTLADDYMAAFGLWTAEPYTVSRSVGQYGILWVAVPDPERSGCDRFSGRDIGACNAVVIGDMSGWVLKSGGDETLVWIAGDYQYEFFHRSHVAPETARLMAGALVPLIDLAPLPEGVAG